MREALKVVEPSEDEILRSARIYLALEHATVDRLGLQYDGKLFTYPCLGFSN